MSILQFFRILMARKWLIVGATLSCVLGAYSLTLILPAQWKADSRVMLNLLKPDPVTGQVIGQAARAYVATQIELITDYTVAGQVVDQLGWLNDPALIAQYRARSKHDVRDFRRWAADIIIKGTKVNNPEGSNILEIEYTATTPENAKAVADAIRQAYIDTNLTNRRVDATRDADWYEQQAQKAKQALDAADVAKAAYQKQNGIVLQDDKVDVDTARLRALASQGAGSMIAPPVATSSAALELTQLDAQIAQSAQTLGPNHPQLKEMKARRDALAALVTKEQNSMTAQAQAANAAAAGAGVLERAVQAQKARVMAQSDKLGRLLQLQTDLELKRDEYNKTAARAAQLRQEAAVADAGITSLGVAATPKDPKFPNMPLIIFGSLGLGIGVGVLTALLAELVDRKVRSVEDLSNAVDVPVLAVIGRVRGKAARQKAPRQALRFRSTRPVQA